MLSTYHIKIINQTPGNQTQSGGKGGERKIWWNNIGENDGYELDYISLPEDWWPITRPLQFCMWQPSRQLKPIIEKDQQYVKELLEHYINASEGKEEQIPDGVPLVALVEHAKNMGVTSLDRGPKVENLNDGGTETKSRYSDQDDTEAKQRS